MTSIRWILAVVLCSAFPLLAQTAAPAYRTWVDQQGRMIKGALISVDADNVVLKLENGSTATVPLSRLSMTDQAFLKGTDKQTEKKSDPAAAAGPLTWPPIVTVNAKDLQIVNGEQNAAARRFVYQSGSFQFTSNASLTGAVMRDIASDFELVRALFQQLPWGWQSKPQNGGPFFLANLLETESDFIAAGGIEDSSGGSTRDYIYTKFSALGLKKVGDRFAFDSKLKREGELIGLITRLLMGDMQSLCMPWSSVGLESFLQDAAYRNGSFTLGNPERNFKAHLEERRKAYFSDEKLVTDVDRMVALLKSDWSSQQDNAVLLRAQRYLDGMVLVYFFGYLDDDGKGTHLHRYYRAVAQEALAWRNFRESRQQNPRPRASGTYAEWSADLNKIVIADRTDAQLHDEIIAKFKTIGVKL